MPGVCQYQITRRDLARWAGAGVLGVGNCAGLQRVEAQADATPTGRRLTIYSGRNENLVGPLHGGVYGRHGDRG
ncbi:MAG: hypothetical protein U0075_20300 [Thermomicrobiales bacterium]